MASNNNNDDNYIKINALLFHWLVATSEMVTENHMSINWWQGGTKKGTT